MEQFNRQLETLTLRLREILGDNLVGIYLHGSLALGCFNPSRSDLDLLAVTHADLTPRSRQTLIETFLSLSGHPTPIEISILKQADLHPWRHPCPYIFHFSEGWRKRLETITDEMVTTGSGDSDLAGHITVLRARGKALFGPPIAEVFPEIPRADFLDSIFEDVLSAEFGLPSETISPIYAVLNACRTLAYLESGAILSKLEGGQWARQQIPARFVPVVEAALAAYQAAGEIPRDGVLNSFKTWMLNRLRNSAHFDV